MGGIGMLVVRTGICCLGVTDQHDAAVVACHREAGGHPPTQMRHIFFLQTRAVLFPHQQAAGVLCPREAGEALRLMPLPLAIWPADLHMRPAGGVHAPYASTSLAGQPTAKRQMLSVFVKRAKPFASIRAPRAMSALRARAHSACQAFHKIFMPLSHQAGCGIQHFFFFSLTTKLATWWTPPR
eukprot:CAMPEP_0198494892 /NCGR_PEP_ID=MMETSP1462-20131121/4875_1 /TAXON_ID=1333877 /ORGANISM="Brandtodinium nutriculum, Strain RCC3387" /LENGTH=182 /DNA_ID=CAMNT_0044223643 /DNA_START=363 /DNA_END=909 /DNA_ORIENTATION=+